MDTREVKTTSAGPVSLAVAFNNDNRCFSVGLEFGFCVFNSDPCELKVSRDFNAGIGVVEMLGQSNYLALVGGGMKPKFPQNKLVIWDDARQKAVITLEFRTSVLRVRLTKSRLVVALQNHVYIYAFSVPPQKISDFETVDNPLGLLSLGEEIVAFPGLSQGQVRLVRLDTSKVNIIAAHTSRLRALEVSADGTLVATASEMGTVIRVFVTESNAKIAEVRRGLDHADIYSLGISPSNTRLAVTSDKSTLHIFNLPHALNPATNLPPEASGEEVMYQKWGILGKIPLLPNIFSDYYSFASAHFEMGDDAPAATKYVPQLGSSIIRPPKGIIGWLTDDKLILIGAGKDGRWEKFEVQEDQNGKRLCNRIGWKKYLGS